jgi:hypothetical protein
MYSEDVSALFKTSDERELETKIEIEIEITKMGP